MLKIRFNNRILAIATLSLAIVSGGGIFLGASTGCQSVQDFSNKYEVSERVIENEELIERYASLATTLALDKLIDSDEEREKVSKVLNDVSSSLEELVGEDGASLLTVRSLVVQELDKYEGREADIARVVLLQIEDLLIAIVDVHFEEWSEDKEKQAIGVLVRGLARGVQDAVAPEEETPEETPTEESTEEDAPEDSVSPEETPEDSTEE